MKKYYYTTKEKYLKYEKENKLNIPYNRFKKLSFQNLIYKDGVLLFTDGPFKLRDELKKLGNEFSLEEALIE